MSFILQISSQFLLVLQRLEKGLEVPFAKAAGTFAFDHFKEDRRSIDNRLGEDLQQVALIVVIDKDPQFRQLLDILGNLANTIQHGLIVIVRRLEKFYAALL